MFRQSFARFYSSFGQQRKLFLLVFLWTCLCLLVFRSTLFNGAHSQQQQQLEADGSHPRAERLAARVSWLDARSSAAPLYLAPEFALPDNSNNDALYYSLSSISSSAAAHRSLSSSHPASVETDTSASYAAQSASISTSDKSAATSSSNKGQSTSDSDNNNNQQQQHETNKQPLNNQSEQQQQQQSHHQHAQTKATATDEFIVGSQCNYDYPSLYDLQFNNIYWQKMTNSGGSNSSATAAAASSATVANYYLYNAYYDDRWRAGPPSVRILAMIDRIQPPPTNCLLWSKRITSSTIQPDDSDDAAAAGSSSTADPKSPARMVPLVTRASFVYAWYPKWGNYKDGLLQPWIVTCPVPRAYHGLVPDSVSLVEVPPALELGAAATGDTDNAGDGGDDDDDTRRKRDASAADVQQQQQSASIAMPPSFSSSSPSVGSAPQAVRSFTAAAASRSSMTAARRQPPVTTYDCKRTLPISNNLPVYNQRPAVKQKFAVCVKGLDFPRDDVSVRLVEWIEMVNLLGAGKIFLYNLDVHENISKVLHYYQQRGIVELSPLTLPGDQPNLPEYQHMYLKSKLTAKRQNELIPYNDCLYRNLNSYEYLALLDIDELIMPLKHQNWYELMHEVERLSLAEQNYSRASYNVRNVYFFDDLSDSPAASSSSKSSASADTSAAGQEPTGQQQVPPTGGQDQQTNGDSAASSNGIPTYLHMMHHVYRSKNYTKPGQYVKCFHNTERVVSLHNHFPMNCFGQCTTYSIPVQLAHLQHYRKDCVGPLKQSCKSDFRVFTTRDTVVWKYKQQMIRRTTRVLNHLGLLNKGASGGGGGGGGGAISTAAPT